MEEQRYTFKKSERLCLVKQIDALFSSGRWLRSEHLRLVYREVDDEQTACARVLVTVSKKNFRRAVKRNLLKRRMRESYRVLKHDLYDRLKEKDKKLHLGFVFHSTQLAGFKTIQQEIKYLLAQLNSRLK